MDKKKYEQFFKDVAMKVEELVSTDKVLMQNMRNALKEFGAQEAKSCQYMKKLYDNAKKEGENFKVSSGMQVPDKYKSPMRAMFSKHEYVKDGYGQKCIGAYLPNLDNNPKECKRRNYVALAIIHDNMLPEAERINNGILPSELAGRIWKLFSPYQVFDNDDRPWYGDKKLFIEFAMMSIQREVAEKPAETKQNRKTTIAAIIISLFIICIFVSLVRFIPFNLFNWLKKHPNSYGLQGSIIFLIPCLIIGLFKPQSRKWCWRVAAIAFVVLFLSLLGGPADSNVN